MRFVDFITEHVAKMITVKQAPRNVVKEWECSESEHTKQQLGKTLAFGFLVLEFKQSAFDVLSEPER